VTTPDQPPVEPVARGSITITADITNSGIFIKLSTTGAYSDETIARRFYSYPSKPPAWVTPCDFWAKILPEIGKMLAPNPPTPVSEET
jgi:hypothetical protein